MLFDVRSGIAIWHISAYQAIRVFIGAAIPEEIGVDELKVHGRLLFDVGIGTELGAIVSADAYAAGPSVCLAMRADRCLMADV